ncbi:MAG: TonB-dependent receptor plug domain-containing protein [Crocinitomicaceae bacterium]
MKNTIVLIMCLLSLSAMAQVKGIIYGSRGETDVKETLYGAKVRLLNAKGGAITDEEGKFDLILPKNLPDTMVFSARGYFSDTVIVTKKDRFISFSITLYSDLLLPDVVVEYKKGTHSISRLKTLAIETISSGELRKAACCNLSESFETNASVDVNITDAVSGAKKIQMMGLDGVYTQIQMENIPYLRGLESSFGLNSMPGTWIESIQITKGTGNVVNGYESMAGLVNIELKKPEEMEALYFNVYGNRFGRTEFNFNSGFKLNEKWSSGWFAHASTSPVEVDLNKDGFRDIPMGTNLAVLNRYKYEGEKMQAQVGFNAYWDNKTGGQTNLIRNSGVDFFDVTLDSRHIDVFAKTGFFMKKPAHSIGVVYNVKYQTFEAKFGNREFKGEEKRGYINAIFDGIIGTTDHKYRLGLSGVYSDLNQQMGSLNADRLEIVPGAFGEYTLTTSRLSLVAGARADYHNIFGLLASPRLHIKYILTEYTDVRFTGGKGWRVPNYMIDNVSLLATSQVWVAPDTVLPEISWNIGGSFSQQFKLFNKKGSFIVDYYHTQFENQMIVDRDANPGLITFGNFNGTSFSNAIQTELSYAPSKTIDVRFAYKFLDVRAKYGGVLQQQVMIPKHRGFVNIGFKSRNKRWEYDLTCSVFGEARLPQVQLADSTLSKDNVSQAYPILNAQITHVYKRWEFYIGGENLTNYRQQNPIIDADNPFSSSFNATRIWAPIYGMNIYAGLRFSIKQSEEKN